MLRAFNNKGFRTHLMVFIAVNLGLLAVNLLSNPHVLWFQWPLVGWGLGLLGHAALVMQQPDIAQMAAGEGGGPGVTSIEERARQLWQVHGEKAIAEVAANARSAEAAGNASNAEMWRKVEAALLQMRGPR